MPGAPGPVLNALALSLTATSASISDFSALNLGQLKALAQPFYDRLFSLDYDGPPFASGTYPWVSGGGTPSDFSAANIGQVKFLFSFDPTYSSDGSPLPDWWRLYYFGGLTVTGSAAIDPTADPNGYGFTNLQDALAGNNPGVNQLVSVGPCVGEYLFHETTGTVAHDLSPLHHNGGLADAASWVPGGGYDGLGAIAFDGTAGFVAIPNTGYVTDPAAGAPFSVAFWFKTGDLPGWTTGLVAFCPFAGFQVGVDSRVSPPNFFLSMTGTSRPQIETPIQPGVWTQAAVTYDGTTFTLYVDGQPEASGTGSFAASTYTNTVGKGYGPDAPFSGEMENLTFYQAVLRPSDVSALYNLSTTSTGPDPSGIPNYWKYQYFGTLNVDPNAFVVWSGTTVTILQAFEECLNPLDFYNGQVPSLSIVSGTNQTGPPGGFVPAPMVVAVTDSNGNPIAGAPVAFSVTSGGGQLQTSSGGTPCSSVTTFADRNGYVQMYFQLPNVDNNTSEVSVTTGTGSTYEQVTFTASSDNGTGVFLSPFAPSDCIGVANGNGNLILTWTNNTDNETAILIEQQQPDGTWQQLASLPPGTGTYTVPAPTPGPYRINPLTPNAANPGAPHPNPSPPVFVPIPVQSYVAIDISGTNASGNPVTNIALDDNNHAAFAFVSGTSDGVPANPPFYFGDFQTYPNYLSYTWQNGTLGSRVVTTSTEVLVDESGTGGIDNWMHQYSPWVVTASGDLYGNEGQYEFYNVDGLAGSVDELNWLIEPPLPTDIYVSEGGSVGSVDPPGPYETVDPISPGCGVIDVSDNGTILGGARLTVSGTGTGSGPHGFTFILQSGSCVVFDTGSYAGVDLSSAPNLTIQPTLFYPVEVNNQAWAIGYTGTYPPGTTAVWTGTASGFIQLSPMATVNGMNNTGQVIGQSGTNGYLWTSGSTSSVCPLVTSGSVQSILGLIPPPYRSNILSVSPSAISNTNATDGSVRILFGASYKTNSSGATSSGTFLLTLTSGTSAITSGTAQTVFRQVALPSNIAANLTSGILNSQGVIADIGNITTGTTTATNHALLLFPFQLTNIADPTQRNGANYRDSQISFLQSSGDTNINSVAWIAASDTTQAILATDTTQTPSVSIFPPRMPELQAQITGLSGYTIWWKLSVINHGLHGPSGNPYRDFDTNAPTLSATQVHLLTSATETGSVGYSDDIYIPFPSSSGGAVVSGSWRSLSSNAPWEIYDDADWQTTLSLAGISAVMPCSVWRFLTAAATPSCPSRAISLGLRAKTPF